MSLLSINNLVTSFTSEGETTRAVDDVSLKLERGQTMGIVGESGSGKSVTALSVMRLIPDPPGKILSGEIKLQVPGNDPIDLLGIDEKEMAKIRGRHISMIFQEPMTSLNPVMTCGKQITEAILLHQPVNKKEAKEKAIHLFNEVKLPRPDDIFKSYPHQLSGGQKQRVMIAMAISSDPAILIADEPTTALDVTVQLTILQLMKEIQDKYGMGIIFITHDLGVIAEIADETAVMYRGKIVEYDRIETLFRNPQHPYTRGLLACRPTLNKRPLKLPTVDDYLNKQESSSTPFSGEIPETDTKERKLYHQQLYAQKPILELEHISTHFPVSSGMFKKRTSLVKAVDDVSLKIYPGETLGLVGESGCGKTTLGRTLLRLTEPTSGRIIFNGQVLNELGFKELRKIRKKIQIIFQDPYSSLNPRITIGNAIMEPMKVHHLYPNEKVRLEKAMKLLEKVQLEEKHFWRYPHEFSGGQRQRICIARALSVKPSFVICDESVSALDVSIQAQILNLLNELKKEYNFTYIFISHDLSVVKYMSDRIAVMKAGKIIEIAEADQLYASPASAYTRELIDSIPTGK